MASLVKNVVDNKQELEKSRLQRRSTFVDLFGVPFTLYGVYSESEGKYVATQWISVSPDFNQWLRWQFKVFVVEGGQSDYHLFIDNIDITQDLKDLHNGEWINSPTNEFGVYPDIEIEESSENSTVSPYYDLLEVASYEVAKGNKSVGNTIIYPRFKKLQVESASPFSLQIYMYQKYSVTGR